MQDKSAQRDTEQILLEAPIQVHTVVEEANRFGGAANVADNICSLGGKASNFRIISNGADGLNIRIEENIISSVKSEMLNADALLISDYNEGVMSKRALSELIALGKQYDVPVVIDPEVENFHDCIGATSVISCMRTASAALGIVIENEDDLLYLGGQIMRKLKLQSLLIYQEMDGMTIFQSDGEGIEYINVIHINPSVKKAYDFTGVRDAISAAFTLSLVSGANSICAARIANCAAGIAMTKAGTECVTSKELLSATRQRECAVA